MSKIGNFFKGLTMGGIFFLALVIVGGTLGVGYKFFGWFQKPTKQSEQITVADLPPLQYDKNANAPKRALPDTTQMTTLAIPEWRAGIMGWNAQAGVAYANGGPSTMKGSIMEEQGVKLRLICQNNCTEQGNQLFAFAQDYAAGNKNSSKGYHMIAWMGDGVPSYLAGLNDQIKKQLGDDYVIQAFTAFGASFGEDKAIYKDGSFRQDPQKLRGSLWVGVLRDGDWNILMKYADLNGIDVNNDPTTYDPTAINWMGIDDYIKAAQIYVSKTTEKRPIVIKGKGTGRDTTVTVDGCVTWTPGDKICFEGRGGVTVFSTKDNGAQMPNTWLACKKWLQDNKAGVEKFILAGCLGGDQVKSHTSALAFACRVQDAVYQDAGLTAGDWQQYFIGKPFTDAQGNMNEIGGSRVFNLADLAEYYGLNGSTDKYKAVYVTFGDLCVKAYPDVMPTYFPYEEVVDLSYVQSVYTNNKNNANMTVASMPTFSENQKMSQLVSNKSYVIEFQTGSATILPASIPTLNQLANDLIIAENLLVAIEGHTDNQGDDGMNMQLSQQRADAVRQWLINKDQKIFRNKVSAQGFGETTPIGDNNTDAGRKKNRRVEIKLGR